MKKLLIVLACLLVVGKVYAQKEANIWYFGNAMSLHFLQDTTEIKTEGNAIQMETACGSICDKNGNLLFYTDGITAWNSKHQKIKNADSLDQSATLAIVPKPQEEGVYYVIGGRVLSRNTSRMRDSVNKNLQEIEQIYDYIPDRTIDPKNAILHYAVIDMRKNKGLGEVIQKKISVLDSCLMDICVLKHQNNKDYWLLVHTTHGKKFLAYKIDQKGISQTPVETSIGLGFRHEFKGGRGFFSNNLLVSSLDGRKVAFLNQDFIPSLQVFDFDNNTGKLYNHRQVTIPNKTRFSCVQFSPDNKKLLIFTSEATSDYKNSKVGICQIDFSSALPEFKNLRIRIVGLAIPQNANYYNNPYKMQLAPNGKIYGTSHVFNLIVVHNPNAKLEDLKVQFDYPLKKNSLTIFPQCTHLLPYVPDLPTQIETGKPFTREILFETNKAILKPEYEKDLQDIVDFLLKNPKTTIEISGHTDNEGEESKNKNLSESRAQALANFLITKQVGKERIKAVGYGSSKPIAENTSPEGKAKNRRIEFLIQ